MVLGTRKPTQPWDQGCFRHGRLKARLLPLKIKLAALGPLPAWSPGFLVPAVCPSRQGTWFTEILRETEGSTGRLGWGHLAAQQDEDGLPQERCGLPGPHRDALRAVERPGPGFLTPVRKLLPRHHHVIGSAGTAGALHPSVLLPFVCSCCGHRAAGGLSPASTLASCLPLRLDLNFSMILQLLEGAQPTPGVQESSGPGPWGPCGSPQESRTLHWASRGGPEGTTSSSSSLIVR